MNIKRKFKIRSNKIYRRKFFHRSVIFTYTEKYHPSVISHFEKWIEIAKGASVSLGVSEHLL